ncbi:MAG: hypothetical protein ABSD21_04875 [Rhizomicrobium sp.]|jgi:hypothetical protein
MNMVIPHAAGQGGNVTVLAPQSQDEVHRQSAVEELAGYLARGGAMLARCEAMSKAARGDRLGPVYAAARLMNANAQVARALAHVALVESRRRMIVETIQSPQPKNAELNSRFLSQENEEDPSVNKDDALAELERRLDRLAEAARQEQEQLEDLAIGCCI